MSVITGHRHVITLMIRKVIIIVRYQAITRQTFNNWTNM